MSGFQDPQNTWNQRFAQAGYLFGQAPNQYLVQQVAHLRPGRALAVADGEGRNGVWLAEQGLAVDAFEFSPVALSPAHGMALASVSTTACSSRVHSATIDWHSRFGRMARAERHTPDKCATIRLAGAMNPERQRAALYVSRRHGHWSLYVSAGSSAPLSSRSRQDIA